MSKIATLISAADVRRDPEALLFVQELCDVGTVDVITYPGLDIALAGNRFDELEPGAFYLRRDFAYTKAQRSVFAFGSAQCVLLLQVESCPHEIYYHNCVECLRQQRQMVDHWNLFDRILLACELPDHRYVHIEDQQSVRPER